MKNKFKHWWMTLIKGVVLIVLAFIVFRHPIATLVGLAVYIGVTLLITGILLIISSLSLRKYDDQWGWQLAEGIMDLLFGIVLISNPGITAAIFPFIVGCWMMIYGVILFVGSFKAKKEGDTNWWLTLMGGILTVLFGYFISGNILAGAIAITVWLGIGLLIFGIASIVISMRLRKLDKILN